MRSSVVLALASALAFAACSSPTEAPPPDRTAAPAPAPAPAQVERLAPDPDSAGRTPPAPAAASPALATDDPDGDVADAGAAVPSASDPGGYHLDDATVEYRVERGAPARRKGRPIELLLRSSPPGAVAAVDGEALGPTPALWQGEADGRPREFTFVMPGFATARYRFVPVRDGVVHGALERIKLAPVDAGP